MRSRFFWGNATCALESEPEVKDYDRFSKINQKGLDENLPSESTDEVTSRHSPGDKSFGDGKSRLSGSISGQSSMEVIIAKGNKSFDKKVLVTGHRRCLQHSG